MKFGIAAIPAAGLFLAGTALAQTMGTQATPGAAPPPSGDAFITMQDSSHALASDMMEMSVVGPGGEDIGTVTDLLIDQDNRVVGVVVTTGGVLGLGGKEVAVPLDRVTFQMQDEQQIVMLPQTKEALEKAPEFKTLSEQRDEQERSMQQSAPPTTAAPTTR